MAEQFANNAASTLNGAINNSTTTIVVATGEGSRFPSVGNFRLLIGLDPFTAEIVLATARSSDTITVVRGQEGSTAQAWGNSTSVTHIVTAGAIEQIKGLIVTNTTTNLNVLDTFRNIFVGTLSSSITLTLPASPTTGDIYVIKDRDGSATAFNIIIAGNGKNIEQFTGAAASSLTLNQNYDSVHLIYNGTFWSII